MTVLTGPQEALLGRIKAQGCVLVRGNSLRVAEALQRRGLITLRIGGSGIAFRGKWWYEAVLRDAPETEVER